MRAVLLLPLVLVFSLLYTARPARGEQPTQNAQASAEQPPSETRAEAYLHIIAEPDTPAANPSIIESLLASEELWASAVAADAKAVAELREHVKLQPVNVQAGGEFMAILEITSTNKDLSAENVLRALAQALNKRLVELDAWRASQEQQILKLHRQAEDQLERLSESRQKYALVLADARIVLPGSIAEQTLSRLTADSQAAELETTKLTVRRDQLENRIAELGKAIEETTAHDPVVAELKKVVEIREQLLNAIAPKSKAAEETLKAEDGIATARAELEKYRRAAAASAGADRLQALQARLADTTTELAEAAATLEYLRQKLKGLHQSNASPALDKLKFEIDVMERTYLKTIEQLQDLEAKFRMRRTPVVSLIR